MERYFTELATAFVRGRLGRADATIADGLAAGLQLHKFKQNTELPRVQRVLGMLRSLAPEDLLDVGSGRGTFLWPLLAHFPALPVTAIDVSEQRTKDVDAVRKGGVNRLCALRMDAQYMAFVPGSFDVVTMLEVLEHMSKPHLALRNAVQIARRFVAVSVPSVPDDNAEHIHLFSVEELKTMATQAGATRVTIEHVLNHRVMLCRTS
jgi:2-polyprenyl-3-methyl-5-hydroxy-6-metoxy-1,4-benzoquinol methylase